MPLSDLPGYQDVHGSYGSVRARDFDELVYMCYDRHYDEDREEYEYQLVLITQGKLGLLEISLGNVVMLKLGSTRQLVGLEVDDVKNLGWDRKRYKLYSIECDDILAYAETCNVSIPAALH